MFAIEKMCRVFKISRSGFYHWLTRKPSARNFIRKAKAGMEVPKSPLNLGIEESEYQGPEWPE
jgi:hypothetical protein